MRVVLGGTFDVLHRGHEALLRTAFELGGEVLIGLTTDAFALGTRSEVTPYGEREANLVRYLRRRRWGPFRVEPIDDAFGPAVREPSLDALVVSAEREAVARELNEARERRGLPTLAIHVVPMFLAEDCVPVSARRIRSGEVDREGRMQRPLRVHVGSTNPVKVRAARQVFRDVFREVRVKGVKVFSEVEEQPFEGDAIRGAANRARAALQDVDFGVGVEAGLFWSEEANAYLDVQWCAVVDKRDVVTYGHGPGFAYPAEVLRRVKEGATVGTAMEALTGVRDIGRRMGAIGYLTKGRWNRTELTKTAVLAALVPRIRRDLYFVR
jgi:inosine/xanthosine triphosphatase